MRSMEERTGKAWSAAERKEYKAVRTQLEADRVWGSEAGKKWRTPCARWKGRGRRPLSNVRSNDSAQRLRQNGWIWDVERNFR